MKRAILITTFLFLLSAGAFAQTDEAVREKAFAEKFDAYVRTTMEKIPDVPGLAVVVVKDDRAIFVRAYGFADREAGTKADTDTLFYIASSTKSFTALAAALIDHEGTIKLSDPVNRYTGRMTMKTAIPDQVTIRDLLTHTSGLTNDPLTFRMAFTGDSDPKEMANVFAGATAYDAAAYGKYKYTNLGYNIYGVLLQEHLRLKWQDVLQKRVFDPLRMKHTTAYPSRSAAKKWTLANGYFFDAGTGNLIRAPLAKTDNNMQSAGGIFTSISDAGRWLAANINDGRVDGKQVFPADVMSALHTGYTQTTRNAPPFTGDGEYGLGWQVGRYKGDRVVYHPGGFTGYSSNISFMPDKKIGVAVLVNNDMVGSRVGATLTTYAFDLWGGADNTDAFYAKQLQDTVDGYKRIKQQMRLSVEQRASRKSQLTLPPAEYAGSYYNEFYGTIEVVAAGSGLTIKMGNINTVSTPYTEKDTIRVEMTPGMGETIKFTKNGDKVASLSYSGSVFTRR